MWPPCGTLGASPRYLRTGAAPSLAPRTARHQYSARLRPRAAPRIPLRKWRGGLHVQGLSEHPPPRPVVSRLVLTVAFS